MKPLISADGRLSLSCFSLNSAKSRQVIGKKVLSQTAIDVLVETLRLEQFLSKYGAVEKRGRYYKITKGTLVCILRKELCLKVMSHEQEVSDLSDFKKFYQNKRR
jgi:hypothetical protein